MDHMDDQTSTYSPAKQAVAKAFATIAKWDHMTTIFYINHGDYEWHGDDPIQALADVLPDTLGITAVLDLHKPGPDGKCPVCVEFHADMDCEQQDSPCATVRLLTGQEA